MTTPGSNQHGISKLVDELSSLHRQIYHGMIELKKRSEELGSRGKHPNGEATHTNGNDKLQIEGLQIVERIERIYVFLEQIALNEARSFSDADKARLRKARAEIQRIRLWLYDVTGARPAGRSSDHNGKDEATSGSSNKKNNRTM